MFIISLRFVFLFLIGLLWALPSLAGSFEVAPTTITLDAETRSSVFYLINRGTEPVTVQVEGFSWEQGEEGDRLTPSDTIMFSPPMARIKPGQRQIVRLAIRKRDPSDVERSFRLIVSELPEADGVAPRNVRMLLQFSVPVFAAATPHDRASIVWDVQKVEENLEITASNRGTRSVKLSDINLTAGGISKHAVASDTFTYILPGSFRRWTVADQAWDTPYIQAYDEREGATIGAPLQIRR